MSRPAAAGALAATLLLPAVSLAEETSLGSRPVPVILLLAGLSLLPFVLVMITSFVRIAVVLSILRSALGTPQVPPTTVITGLAVVLSLYVMAPTGSEVMEAVKPALSSGAGQGVFLVGGRGRAVRGGFSRARADPQVPAAAQLGPRPAPVL